MLTAKPLLASNVVVQNPTAAACLRERSQKCTAPVQNLFLPEPEGGWRNETTRALVGVGDEGARFDVRVGAFVSFPSTIPVSEVCVAIGGFLFD